MADASAAVTGIAPGALAGVSSHTCRARAGNISRNELGVTVARPGGWLAGTEKTVPATRLAGAASRPLGEAAQVSKAAGWEVSNLPASGRPGHADVMHKTSGVRDPAAAFPLPRVRDDAADRREANRAIAVSAIGLAATGAIELALALVTGSVGLLGDAIHNLSDVSTSAVVFLGFRLSRRPATERYPYGLERAEDLAGVGIAVVIWASAAFAGYESIRKLVEHGHTAHVGAGIAGAVIGIVGNQVVARYKLITGKRIGSATLVADARHSWLDALSSAGALAGLIAVAAGQPWGDPVAGLAVTAFICHVGYEVTRDVVRRLADGIDPDVIYTAEAAAGSVPGVIHAHARARWTGRTLRVEIEGWVDPGTTARQADDLGRQVADATAGQLPEAGSLT
jgi:cation diffusion facilitator family transporter